MTKVLYAKYNSLRCPDYRIVTEIREDEGGRYVLKKPLANRAYAHINGMEKKRELLANAYSNIEVIDCEMTDEGLRFPYIEGRPLTELIASGKLDEKKTVARFNDFFKKAFKVKKKCITEFKAGVQFRSVFGDVYPEGGTAINPVNIDSIPENFMENDGKLYCIDYEWVMDFPVPLDFLKFRALLYSYGTLLPHFVNRVTREEFFSWFGFDEEDFDIYFAMEDNFQQHVHGVNRKYRYLENYKKNVVTLDEINVSSGDLKKHIQYLNNAIADKDRHIENLEGIVRNQGEKLQKIKRSVKNPVYGAYTAAKYGKNKAVSVKNRVLGEALPKEKPASDYDFYKSWVKYREKFDKVHETFEYNPKISVIMPVYNMENRYLVPCIESVLSQSYKNWELCISDDASTLETVKPTLEKFADGEKVKVFYRKKNGHISENTNSALKLATGEFIALLDCDDLLQRDALYEMVKKLNENPELDFIYSDEDKISDDGTKRHMPHFKPEWSPDYFMSCMYTCHLGLYRKSLIDEIGGFRKGYEGAQDYDLVLRLTEKTDRIGHIAKVLYHWRERNGSTAIDPNSKPYFTEAERKAKEDALRRRGLKGMLEYMDGLFQYRVNYIPDRKHKVSVVIPSKDHPDVLEVCLKTLRQNTSYKNYEIVVVDNGSADEAKTEYEALCKNYKAKYVYRPMEFNFSAMCNIGAAESNGDYILFLNDDIEITDGSFMERMLGQAELPHTGAVGAKLYYPGGKKIQHAGVICIKDGPSHVLGGMEDDRGYYFNHNLLTVNYLAVTAACVMLSREKFDEVGGFDEKLAVNYNDVDLCMKLAEHGYYNVVRNDAVLIHHESISRGNPMYDEEKMQALKKELKKLYKVHPAYEANDPFYSPNLSQTAVDFSYCAAAQIADKTKLFKAKEFQPSKLRGLRGGITAIFDETVIKDGVATVSGWYTAEDPELDNESEAVLVYSSKGKTYIVKTQKLHRSDVGAQFNDGTCETGFYSRFKCDAASADFKKIGILLLHERRRIFKWINTGITGNRRQK